MRGKNLGRPGVSLLSAAAGLACAYLLHAGLNPPTALEWLKPAKAKVSFRAAPAPAPPAPTPAPLVKTDAVLPLKSDKPVTPRSVEKKNAAAPPPQGPTSATAPDSPAQLEPAPVLPTLSQPAMAIWRPSGVPENVPAIATEPPLRQLGPLGAPPLPSDVPEFRSGLAAFEKPGGDVLVLALLVNELGIVVDSSIVVPSQLALQDLALTWSYIGKQWAQIDPPLLQGEYRWFEIRVDHFLEMQRKSVLP